MEMRVFGRTGMQLSVLGFGCGAVGGLMVRGAPPGRATLHVRKKKPEGVKPANQSMRLLGVHPYGAAAETEKWGKVIRSANIKPD